MKYLVFCTLFFIAACNNIPADESKDIEAILQAQASAWNEGDIEAYMKRGYWQNDSLVFIGSKGRTYGFDATLNNYKRSYPDKEHMGTLHFTDLQYKRLSTEYYWVLGQWHLSGTPMTLDGNFTLLFKKIDGEWCIVADHSS